MLVVHTVLPPHVLVSSFWPDLFILNEAESIIVMLELTCPFDSNIVRSHEFKQEKYSPLVADLARYYRTKYYPVEVSVRGQITKSNKARLKSLLYECCNDPKGILKTLLVNCSKISLLSSYSIFSAR